MKRDEQVADILCGCFFGGVHRLQGVIDGDKKLTHVPQIVSRGSLRGQQRELRFQCAADRENIIPICFAGAIVIEQLFFEKILNIFIDIKPPVLKNSKKFFERAVSFSAAACIGVLNRGPFSPIIFLLFIRRFS